MYSKVHSEAAQRQDGAGNHFGPTRPLPAGSSRLVIIYGSARSCRKLPQSKALTRRAWTHGQAVKPVCDVLSLYIMSAQAGC